MTGHILTFEEITAADVGVVGGKGANLGEMTRARLPVPPGFCLTAQAYLEFIAASNSQAMIDTILADLNYADAEEVEVKTAQLRRMLTMQAIPPEIALEALDAYHNLAARQGFDSTALPVAIRSSATAEDLPDASFAGQQDTYLNIRGDDAVLEHIRRCWASLWTARAVVYRHKQGFDHRQVALAVVVQAMVDSEVAGILFTANPVNNHLDEMVINASYGLGEAVVAGLVTPDTWVALKEDGTVISREIASKNIALGYASDGGTIQIEVPADRRELPSLDDSQIGQLVVLGRQVERHYQQPMDIEWAYARSKFYMLQARPITTLSVRAPAAVEAQTEIIPGATGEYNRTMFVEIFPDPLSPAFLSVIAPLFHSMLAFFFETLGFKPPRDIPAVGVFFNQPYFHREYIEAALAPLSPEVRETMVAQSLNPFGRHSNKMHGELSPAYIGMIARLMRFMLGFPKQLPALLAEYRAEIEEMNRIPAGELTDEGIIAKVKELVFDDGRRLLNYDFLMIALIGITYQMLGTLLTRYYGEDSEQVRARLISGVTGNVTMETNKRIWELAQEAKKSAAVSAALAHDNAAELRAELLKSGEGRIFLAELDAFLEQYGHREIRMDILYPTWGEDPTPVLRFIRGYLEVGEASSPHRQQERLVNDRKALAQEVVERVRSDLAGRFAVSPLFRWVLKNTQAHTRERDTMHFELTRLFPPFRRLILELGARWSARGYFDEREDIFFLTLEEMEHLLHEPRSMHEIVKQRRAEFEANKRRMPPPIIRDGKAVHMTRLQEADQGKGQLRGVAGSPGQVCGAARIIRGPDDFTNLKKGEILVAPLTNPVWTPLFAIAGGVVTEVGGILSHGAIVAREYGIPAVMGVPNVTHLIVDGQQLMVDGSTGLVSVGMAG